MRYNICEYCGAALDCGERCDCIESSLRQKKKSVRHYQYRTDKVLMKKELRNTTTL